jgi:hypothetical protein
MEPETHALYMHAFHADVSILSGGPSTGPSAGPSASSATRSPNLGRAVNTSASELLLLAPSLKDLIEAAKALPDHEGERTVTCGVHPNTTCSDTGETPVTGWLYRSGARQLCEAAFSALEPEERSAYIKVAPVAYPCADATDDDDGLPCVALPGTRRAIQLLVRYAQQKRWIELDHCFTDREQSVAQEIYSDDKLTCEYLECLCGVGADESAFTDDIGFALEGSGLRAHAASPLLAIPPACARDAASPLLANPAARTPDDVRPGSASSVRRAALR